MRSDILPTALLLAGIAILRTMALPAFSAWSAINGNIGCGVGDPSNDAVDAKPEAQDRS